MMWNGAIFHMAVFMAVHEAHLELMQQQPQVLLRINPYLAYELRSVAQVQAVEQGKPEDRCGHDDTEVTRCSLVSLHCRG